MNYSSSFTVNENAGPTVRSDFEAYFNKSVPENEPYYTHSFEGEDDLPAHLKTSILGAHLSIPIGNGALSMGTCQGIDLCEHRNYGGSKNM